MLADVIPDVNHAYRLHCPLVPGSTLPSINPYTAEGNLLPSSTVALSVVVRALNWCSYCNDKNFDFSVPPNASCLRSLSSFRVLPMWFGDCIGGNRIPPLTNSTNACTEFIRWLQHTVRNDRSIGISTLRFGDQQTYCQMLKIFDTPDFADLEAAPGGFHFHANTANSILKMFGDIIRPLLRNLGRKGIADLPKKFIHLDDAIVVLTQALLRVALGFLRRNHINTFDGAAIMNFLEHSTGQEGSLNPRMRALCLFAVRYGAPYCYMRALGRAGRTLEWLSVAYSFENVFAAAGHKNYRILINRTLTDFGTMTLLQKQKFLESFFLRTNPNSATAKAADDLCEKVHIPLNYNHNAKQTSQTRSLPRPRYKPWSLPRPRFTYRGRGT